MRFLVTGEDSNSSMAAFEVTVPGSQRLAAPAHSHDHYEETIYGLTGVLTWTVDGKPVNVAPGQALCIPRGAVHRFEGESDPDDMSVVYAIESQDGTRGVLVDAFGTYADPHVAEILKQVPICDSPDRQDGRC